MSNGASRTVMLAGSGPAPIGKFRREKFGAPPIAEIRFDTSARWLISSIAIDTVARRQRAIAASCPAVTPSSSPLFNPKAAYR